MSKEAAGDLADSVTGVTHDKDCISVLNGISAQSAAVL